MDSDAKGRKSLALLKAAASTFPHKSSVFKYVQCECDYHKKDIYTNWNYHRKKDLGFVIGDLCQQFRKTHLLNEVFLDRSYS